MKEYYTHNGTSQQGPFSLEELLKSGIKSDTPIWHSGLETWTPAKNLDELKSIFAHQPPPLPVAPPAIPPPVFSGPSLPYPTPTKRSYGWIWKTLLGIILLVVGVLAFNRFSNNGSSNRGAYYENKMSVEEYERANPALFLEASGTYREALFSTKMVVKGKVTNRATVANYKDIIIEVSYYSSTNSLIDKERFTMYEFVPAHTTKSFDWRIKPPGGTSTMGWKAVGGVGY